MTRRRRAAPAAGAVWAAWAAAVLLAGCGGSLPPAPAVASRAVPAAAVQAWVTQADRTRLLAPDPAPPAFGPAGGGAAIEVDAARRYQTMAGFGASITDASAWLIQHRLDPVQRRALLAELFGRGESGVGFELARVTIGASDFSRSHYSFDDRPPGEADPALAHFSIEPHRAEMLPVLRAMRELNPRLQLMASPWSAPGWMKTSGSLIRGALREDMHEPFARYLVRFVEAYAAEGLPVFALTVQNEPHFEPPDYPGMRVEPAARAALVGRHLGPLLAQRAPATTVIEWDHNWDDPSAPLAVLADPAARRHVSGVGWHCYVDEKHLPNQSLVHDAHPDKDVWFTECSGGAWKPHWPETLPWMARVLVIGTIRHWARGVLMWNLALDEHGGPHLGGCPDCRGIVTIDSRSGEVTRNMEYYAFAHASRFVRPGARRIGSEGGGDGLDHVAFHNADDGSRVLVVCNSAADARRFTVREGAREFGYTLPRESLATFVWAP